MKILVIAPPRSGTGYAAKCLQDIGFDVGHEKLGKDGISSWLWAVDCVDNARWGDNYQQVKPDITVMLERNLFDHIASLAFTASNAFEWMGRYITYDKEAPVHVQAAQLSKGWRKCCLTRRPDHTVQTERFDEFCKREFDIIPDPALKNYNTRKHRPLTKSECEDVHEIYYS